MKFDTLAAVLGPPFETLAESIKFRSKPMPMRSEVKAIVLHCYEPSEGHDKVYAIWIENRGGQQPFFVCGAYGKRTMQGMLKVDPKGAFTHLQAANSKMNQIVRDKEKKGYLDVDGPKPFGARPNVEFFDIINPSKVDISRIIGYSTSAEVIVQAAPITAAGKPKQQQVGHGRAHRSINL